MTGPLTAPVGPVTNKAGRTHDSRCTGCGTKFAYARPGNAIHSLCEDCLFTDETPPAHARDRGVRA